MSSSESGAFAVPADLNALAPHIWPAGATRSTATGVVSVRGHDVRELAREFHTPAYVLDEVEFRDRIGRLLRKQPMATLMCTTPAKHSCVRLSCAGWMKRASTLMSAQQAS